jgi:hypothetical protein
MVKRYNQFVKERINENIDESDDFESQDDFTQDDFEDQDDSEGQDEFDEFDDLEGQNELDDEDYLDEEEGVDLYTSKLKELADALGTEVKDGKVEYEGKQIIFPSETEKYHVGNKKFNTVEEVVNFLNGNSQAQPQATEKSIGREGDFSLEREDEYSMDEEELESKSYKNRRLKKW